MARMARIDLRQFRRLRQNLNRIDPRQLDVFVESLTKELAARLLAKVKKRTPVGNYTRTVKVKAKRDSKNHKKGDTYTRRVNTSGKVGGTLRRGWTVGTITKSGNLYTVEVINPTEYASYVEYGHRTRNHNGWVRGRFMMTISQQEIEQLAPRLIEQRIDQLLRGVFR